MPVNTTEATHRKLFGGAMECLLPPAYVDVSEIRQVPDHQEVFVSKEGRVSIIVELLSFEENLPSNEEGASARHFFNDLGTANGASTSVCDFCADLSDSIMPELESFSKVVLAGRQTIAKFRGNSPPEAVRVYLVNARLPNVATDLLITVNIPYPDEESAAQSMASAECFTGAVRPHDASSSETPGTRDTTYGDSEAAEQSAEAGGPPPTEGDEASLQNEVDVPGTSEDKTNSSLSRQSPEVAGRLEDSILGIASLKILLQSFVILDWSLFC